MKATMLKCLFLCLLALLFSTCDNSFGTIESNNISAAKHHNYDVVGANTDYVVVLLKKRENVESVLKASGGILDDQLTIGTKQYIRIKNSKKDLDYINGLQNVVHAEFDQNRIIYQNQNASNTVIPNDLRYNAQYAPQLANLPQVWKNYTGKGVIVAVIDSGVNTLHEDFGGSSAFINGYDYYSQSVYGTTYQADYNGHGTHVAGIIAARKDNGIGITGVAPEATIMPLKAASDGGFLSSYNVSKAIKFAVDNGADLINMSFGGPIATFTEQDAVQYAIEHGVSLVASSGNDSVEFINFPASFPGVISVGSSNGLDKVSSFSTLNSMLSVTAPGEDIVSLDIGAIASNGADYVSRTYVSKSGTSMSAPFVSGLVALLKQKFPLASPLQIKQILEDTALDIHTQGYDSASGHGRVRPVEALAISTLPEVNWRKLDFTITINNIPENYYSIQLLNPTNNLNMYNLFTSDQGKASVFLPQGTYKYVSSKFGVSFNGELTLSTQDLQLTKNFTNADFVNYFKIYTYKQKDELSVDTVVKLSIQNRDSDGNFLDKTGSFAENDDISISNTFSELVLYRRSDVYYLITISSFRAGTFNFRVSSDIFSSNIAEGDIHNSLPQPNAGVAYARVEADQDYSISLSTNETKTLLFYQ